MKIVIFGATSSVGAHLTHQALDQGHTVTAFTRQSASIKLTHGNLKIVEGDVFDDQAVDSAISGQDAVICSLGAGRHLTSTVRSEGTQKIVNSMKRQNVDRLICQTTLGAGDSYETLNFYWKYLMFGFLLRGVFKDHQRQEKIVFDSDLIWTIVRPGAFTNGELTGVYRCGFSANAKGLLLKLSRADVADSMLTQLNNIKGHLKTINVSY